MKHLLSNIAATLGVPLHGADRSIETLLTDSRSLSAPSSTLFFALTTKGNDGHRYIAPLYAKGVRAFVTGHLPADVPAMEDASFIVVGNVADALLKVGALHAGLKAEVVAITGSRGKTTLKEWLFMLLSENKRVVRSPRSYNSQIGVPLSLWEIDADTDLALIEAGISQPGEMERLAEAIRPSTVIFTNIGPDHDEGFESRMEKARQKALLAAAPSVKRIVFNADDPLLCRAIGEISGDKEIFAWSRADVSATIFISKVESKGKTTLIDYTFRGAEASFEIPFEDDAAIENACNALAFMLASGYHPDAIASLFAKVRHIDTRLDVSEGVNNCSLIFDAFPADLSSLAPALDFMRRRRSPALQPAIIMSELHHSAWGEVQTYAHAAELIRNSGIERFIGIGKSIKTYARLFGPQARFFDTCDDFLASMTTSDFSHELILIKGEAGTGFESILEMLEARKHETVLEVDLDAVAANYNYFRSLLPSSTGLIAMVKASAYGAGSLEIARTMQERGAAYLAVAVVDEGVDLRRNGITMPIMVMNPKVLNYRQLFEWQLEPEIYNFEMLTDVVREAEKNGITEFPIHIKLDTGMHRMGFIEEELQELMERLASQTRVRPATVFSHLATADCLDMDDYTLLQLERFDRCSRYVQQHSSWPVKRHVLNTAGIVRFGQYHYDFARLGIGLYGIDTLPDDIEHPLSPVSTLRTIITGIREWEAGETIGYGRRGVLKRHSRIATLPIGYADGMNRKFGQGAVQLLVNGKLAPTIGNICMDACMIDVTGIDCKVGDSVEIFGKGLSVQRLADVLGTIPYEVLTSVSPRVKRVYFRE